MSTKLDTPDGQVEGDPLPKAEAARRFPHLIVTYATADALLLADWAQSRMTSAPRS